MNSIVVTFMLIAGLIGYGAFLANQLFTSIESLRRKETWFWLIAATTCILIKLWLVTPGTLFAIANAGHDDQLFVKQAKNIINGDWLGPYSQYTLMKGPMYSIWIAGVFQLGIPLLLAQHLLYIMMTAMLATGIKPIVKKKWALFLIFAVLLFNPLVSDTGDIARVLRSGISPALTIGVLAGLIGLNTRRKDSLWVFFSWALITGVSLSAFWLNREEGIWILALVLPLWTGTLYTIWREKIPHKRKKTVMMLTPWLTLTVSLALVSTINLFHYGIFTTCEFKAKPFKDAYGALIRIQPKKKKPFIPVAQETLQRAYAVSPAFTKLKPFLEGDNGRTFWARHRVVGSREPIDSGEIEAGWFVWAFRDAVVSSGNASSGAVAMEFYATMAKEINAACDRGELSCRKKRSGFAPIFDIQDFSKIGSAFVQVWFFIINYQKMTFHKPVSFGNIDNLELFADITRERINTGEAPFVVTEKQKELDSLKAAILSGIGQAYKGLSPILGTIAFILFFISAINAIQKHSWDVLLTVNVALIFGLSTLIGIVAIIAATSFGKDAISVSYTAPCHSLYLLFLTISWIPWLERFKFVGAMSKTPRFENQNIPST